MSNYLSRPYSINRLNELPVSGVLAIAGVDYFDLRRHVKRDIASGDIRGAFTATQVSLLKKQQCITLLMGGQLESGEIPTQDEINAPAEMEEKAAPVNPAPAPIIAPAPATPDAAAQALATLQGLFGSKVDAAEIKRQVETLTAPELAKLAAIADANRKLAEESRAEVAALVKSLQEENEKLRAEMLAGKPVTITVVDTKGEQRDAGRQHFLFELVLKTLSARCHPYLVGPAGSFKTSTCHAAANCLGMKFYAISVCAQTTKTDLLGFFVPGNGEYCPTDFRRAFEHGGVFVCDEVDNGNANVLAVLNAALANSSMAFPDGMVTRHEDFCLIACGNTYGQGADRLYVGRNQLDAATLDRFAFIDFPYDEGLEALYCGVEGRRSPSFNLLDGGSVTADGWLDYVQRVRKAGEKQKVRAVFSPRASIYGTKLAAQGIGRAHLEAMLLWKGIDAATVAKIKAAL